MLPAPPARPFLSLLFPDPAGDLIDLQQLQQQLERAGQLRYARLRLPWVRSDDGSGAPQLAVVQGSSGSWIASLVPEGAGHPVVVQHAVTGRDPQGWRAPQTAPAPPPGSVPLPDGIVAAWQLGNCAFVATVTGEGGNLGTRMYEKQIFPASQGLQGRLSRHWPAQIGPQPSLTPGPCVVAVDDATETAWLLNGGGMQTVNATLRAGLGETPVEWRWPGGGAGQPVAAVIHGRQLLCVSRGGPEGRQLQLWATDPYEMQRSSFLFRGRGRGSEEPEPVAGSAWRQVAGAGFELPAAVAGFSIAAAPNQAGRIVLVLQPQQGQQAQHASAQPQQAQASGAQLQHGQQAQQVQQDRAQPSATAAEPLLLVFEPEQKRWIGLQRPLLSELSSTPSWGSGGSSGSAGSSRAAAQQQAAAKEPWWMQDAASPSVVCSDFFAAPIHTDTRGAAAQAAAAAGHAAMQAAPAADMAAGGSAEATAALARQRRQAVALAVDGTDSMVAVWRSWDLPQPPRLGEITAPEGLPYDLRHSQVVRALAAGAAGTTGTVAGAAGAAGAAEAASAAADAGVAALGSGGDRTASSSSSYVGGDRTVLLRIAADPSLPPIPCPLSAAAQCGELCRLLEVLGEDGQAPCSPPQQQQQDQPDQQQQAAVLPLAGVAPQEHAALQQLVSCLAGRTHSGLLESTLLLDVARLADLLDAPALLRECLAALNCVMPGPETFAPLLALAEGRQYHAELQRLQLFYRHTLALHILEVRRPLLAWALHGLRAGVDAIVEVCTEVAARWLPLQPELYLGSPAGDLETFSADDFQAAAADQPAKLRPLLEALLPLWRLQLDNAAELAPGGTQHKRSKGSTKAAAAAAAGPFRSAAVRPPPPDPSSLPDAALQQEARRLLQQLQRAMPAQRKREREARTAAAFEQADGDSGWAAAEARARRHRQPI